MSEDEWEELKQQGSEQRSRYDRNEIIKDGPGCYVVMYNRKGIPTGSTMIDLEDAPFICDYKWSVTTAGYAVAWINGKLTYLHHVITNHRPNHYMVVDHVNGNTLDNRRANLRIVSKSINSMNSNKNLGVTSSFRGVYYDKSKRRWAARLTVNGELVLFKRFKTESEAAIAYRETKQEVMNGCR